MSGRMGGVSIIAFTQRGCALASRLARSIARAGVFAPERMADEFDAEPFESLDAWAAEHFEVDDALVFVGATGIAVRAIAPHVRDKFSDPAVVAVDEAGRYAVPLLSGHVGGANELAREVARICGGSAVISTATDVNGLFAVDEWASRHGFAIVERELAKEISSRLLEGGAVGSLVEGALAAELPAAVKADSADLGFVVSLDEALIPFERTLHLVPRRIALGVGCRKGAAPEALAEAARAALGKAGVSEHAVAFVASIDVKRGEPAIELLARSFGCEARYLSAEELREVPGVFAESDFVEQTVGVGNVCERAALASGGDLLVGKQTGDGVTAAVAMLPDPACRKTLSVIGIGPGGAADMTRRAYEELRACDLIIGYGVYTDLLKGEFGDKEMLTTPMRKEVERCEMALAAANEGRRVAMVCSGDPGVYGMAGLVLELAPSYPGVSVNVIAGVSASNGGAAVLGAPLMHDYCVISLSDLLTPWESIECRLRLAAEGDFAVSLYNPSSHKRPDYLKRACDVLLSAGKAPETICGTVRNIGRQGESAETLTLAELREAEVDMFTTVFIGNSKTRIVDGHMVTPRGYLTRESE